MSIRTKSTVLCGAVLALTLSFSGATVAFGATEAPGAATPLLAADAALDPRLAPATDLELLALLLAGSGPIAVANPELIDELGIDQATTTAQVDVMASVAVQFLAAYPAFSTTWAPAIKSSDPATRDMGINGFMTDFVDFVMTHCRPSCTG